jgi:methyl-accepting chemotaxis protein
MKKISLSTRFALVILMFAAIIGVILYMMIAAKNEPINFGRQEMVGNAYQRPIEKVLRHLMFHRIVAQRVLNGERSSLPTLETLQKSIDQGFVALQEAHAELGERLQFTDAGLKSRKRDHLTIGNVLGEWSELKSRLHGLKPEESNKNHAHLISVLRGMITHLGDTSNLVLDPDLDSYYLMDITLLALPQTQDRIQNATVEMEPWVRKKSVTEGERIKASVFASMMNEADLERIGGDFQTVLNEDANFYGKLPSLESQLKPQHEAFLEAYRRLIEVANKVASGEAVPLDSFLKTSEAALNASFDYWDAAAKEMDALLQERISSHQGRRTWAVVLSVISFLFATSLAGIFMRYLGHDMREFLKMLNGLSDRISGASVETASSSSELSEAAVQQAASIQQTMASVEQISAMVSQNAESASKTRDAVQANQKASDQGNESAGDLLKAITEIKSTNDEILNQMENSSQEFAEIVRIISAIETKTNVINEIVFQTKLLSFNASVEAARAGEHGKGFAVVAEEVGNLAQMSGNAAKEITDMLATSTKKVNEIVERTQDKVERLVEVGKDKITMGQATAQKCSQALQQITQNARTVVGMIEEIANASKEQAQGVREINKAISQLDQVTQQNAAVAQKSSTQAEELNAQADALSQAVHSFTVFIDGEKSVGPHTTEKNAGGAAKAPPAKVIPLKANKHKPRLDRASGSDVPSSSDPQFEEF